MAKIENISLKFSCPKTRSTLDKVNGEHHCSDCSKAVIDFTNKSNDELRAIINNSSNPVCGIFNQSQLSRQFVKYAAATLFAGYSFISASHAQE